MKTHEVEIDQGMVFVHYVHRDSQIYRCRILSPFRVEPPPGIVPWDLVPSLSDWADDNEVELDRLLERLRG